MHYMVILLLIYSLCSKICFKYIALANRLIVFSTQLLNRKCYQYTSEITDKQTISIDFDLKRNNLYIHHYFL